MYYRLYADKNNTIFQQFAPNTNDVLPWSLSVNTGASPSLELRDGASKSMVLLGFKIPDWLRAKMLSAEYKVNLKIFDSGAKYDSLLPLKAIQLKYFGEDFAEGDGWFFDKSNAKSGVSNWVNNLENSLWSDVDFSFPLGHHLNKDNEDLTFDVTQSVQANISNSNALYNYALSVLNPQQDRNILSKFFWSRHTKTAFQPYLEFVINDEIRDCAYNLMAGEANKIYFINENGVDFTDSVTATVYDNSGTIILNAVPASNDTAGVNFITVTPPEPRMINKAEYIKIVWMIGDRQVYSQTLKVNPKNQFIKNIEYRNIMFYPVSSYTNNIVFKGDIMFFEIISQIRGQNDIVLNSYEYKVVDSGGYEVVPWMPINIYRNKMYFYVCSDYFYQGFTYEVILRNKMPNFQITSNMKYRFKLIQNSVSNLKDVSASPYYTRDWYILK